MVSSTACHSYYYHLTNGKREARSLVIKRGSQPFVCEQLLFMLQLSNHFYSSVHKLPFIFTWSTFGTDCIGQRPGNIVADTLLETNYENCLIYFYWLKRPLAARIIGEITTPRPKKKNDGVAITRPTLIICRDPKVFWMFNKKKILQSDLRP